MNSVMRLGLLAVLAFALSLAAGCSAKHQTVAVDVPDASIVDRSLPVLTGEARAAAEQITNAKIYFEYDKFDLKDDSKRVLAQKAEMLKRFPQIKVSIQGHCDERGTEEYNLALGERRARAAQEFLVFSGVNAVQLEIVSMGKLHPAVQGHNENAWSMNRRDEFIVLNPMR